MTGRKLAVFTVVLVAMFAMTISNAWCSDDFMRTTQGYGAGFWYASVFGQITDANGNSMSLRRNLGLDNAYGFNGDINWEFSEKWGADVNIFYMKGEQKDYITPDAFTFSGVAVNAGDVMNTTVKTTGLTFNLRYSLVRNEDSRFDIGVAPKWLKIESTVTRPGATVWNEDESIVIPCVSLSGKQRIADNVYLDGSIQGIAYQDTHMIDFRADLRYNFQAPGWYATLGYRVIDAKADLGNNRTGNLNWNGPVATLRYEF